MLQRCFCLIHLGASLIRFGENGKGLKSRWYAATLARRIRDIHGVREKIEVVCGDGLAVIDSHRKNGKAAFFIDPPYTAAGKKAGRRLYPYHVLDHERLFATTARVAGDFLMTYDNADEIVAMAGRHGLQTRTIPMKNTHHARMTELLIGKNFSWLRDAPNARESVSRNAQGTLAFRR